MNNLSSSTEKVFRKLRKSLNNKKVPEKRISIENIELQKATKLRYIESLNLLTILNCS